MREEEQLYLVRGISPHPFLRKDKLVVHVHVECFDLRKGLERIVHEDKGNQNGFIELSDLQ